MFRNTVHVLAIGLLGSFLAGALENTTIEATSEPKRHQPTFFVVGDASRRAAPPATGYAFFLALGFGGLGSGRRKEENSTTP